MNQPYNYHPNLLSKDLEGVTQTHTYTEKPYSYFDPTHEEVIPHNADQKMHLINEPNGFQKNQKTLTKVRSMPLGLYHPMSEGHNPKSGENLEIRQHPNIRETANRITKDTRNSQFPNFSPILNRVKSSELNKTLNTNLESRQLLTNDITLNQTPKIYHDRFHFKSSQGYIDPVTFENSFQNQSKQNLSPIRQQRPLNFNKNQVRISQVFNAPVPNVRIPSNERVSETIQSPLNRNVNLSPTNQALRPLVAFQKPQNVSYASQQVIRSNMLGHNEISKYQSIIYDPAKQNKIQDINSKRQKISFAKIQQNTQRLEQVEFERPQFRKIYDNKEQCFRTVGPQDDYYKQEKTTCSKILPVLGVAIFLLLLAGTLFGLGVMTGYVGGKNYLSRNEDRLIEKEKESFTTTDENLYVSNEVENGGKQLTKQNDLSEVVIPPVLEPVTIEKTQQQGTQKVEQKQTVNKDEEISTIVAIPETPTQKQVQVPTETIENPVYTSIEPAESAQLTKPAEPVEPVEQVTKPSTQVITPVTTPIPVQPKPQVSENIEPQVIEQPLTPIPVPATEQKPSKDSVKVKTEVQTESSIQPTIVSPVETMEALPATQPQKTTQQLTDELFQSKPQPVVIIPTQTPKQQQIQVIPQPNIVQKQTSIPAESVPVTQPSTVQNKQKKQNKQNKQKKVQIPEQQFIEASPITLQQAGKVVDVIIEENHQIIPLNVKSTLKKDILDQFEQVPLNFKDVSHVQKISYKHLQKIVNSDPSHKSTSNQINYRHHDVKQI